MHWYTAAVTVYESVSSPGNCVAPDLVCEVCEWLYRLTVLSSSHAVQKQWLWTVKEATVVPQQHSACTVKYGVAARLCPDNMLTPYQGPSAQDIAPALSARSGANQLTSAHAY